MVWGGGVGGTRGEIQSRVEDSPLFLPVLFIPFFYSLFLPLHLQPESVFDSLGCQD